LEIAIQVPISLRFAPGTVPRRTVHEFLRDKKAGRVDSGFKIEPVISRFGLRLAASGPQLGKSYAPQRRFLCPAFLFVNPAFPAQGAWSDLASETFVGKGPVV